jgi:hypothetical protein
MRWFIVGKHLVGMQRHKAQQPQCGLWCPLHNVLHNVIDVDGIGRFGALVACFVA